MSEPRNDREMTLIPAGTEIFVSPQDERRVMLVFPTSDDAIIFCELIGSYSK